MVLKANPENPPCFFSHFERHPRSFSERADSPKAALRRRLCEDIHRTVGTKKANKRQKRGQNGQPKKNQENENHFEAPRSGLVLLFYPLPPQTHQARALEQRAQLRSVMALPRRRRAAGGGGDCHALGGWGGSVGWGGVGGWGWVGGLTLMGLGLILAFGAGFHDQMRPVLAAFRAGVTCSSQKAVPSDQNSREGSGGRFFFQKGCTITYNLCPIKGHRSMH